MRGKVVERLDGSVRPHRRSSGAGRDKPARRAHKPRSRCGLGDEILVVGIDVSIVVGVSIVVVQCGDDGRLHDDQRPDWHRSPHLFLFPYR